ncbi:MULTISPECIES: hypothetical protein [unclassified Streptomyces]|uniref:hypothetical protein n=1 Tax=unclassified Streptomyces TaxID=2593676 RepID=UPI002E363085|nr:MULTISPECIES: hypothetical protein [unclassified Streptomyces]WUC65714.1 hypothetical protein OG861_16535 [Streptomyces sp. NBC_00539]
MRHPLRRTAAVLAPAVAVLAFVTGCSGGAGHADAAGEPAAAPPVVLPAPRSAPAPAAVLAQPVRQGEVRVEQGPFTDRLRLERLTLTDRQTVTGHATITADVSDTLALELSVAYYDSSGHLVGTGAFQYQEEGEDAHGTERHDGPRAAGDGIDFTVSPGKLTGTPAGAVLTVPVLVSE